MGGAVSAGSSNDELIDNLVEADYIKTPEVERIFRAVDRAEYYLENHRENAYKGAYAINHGIELHEDVVEYSREKLSNYIKTTELFDAHELAMPQFSVGNCLMLQPGWRLYDRVYCGAACPPEHENYMKNLIKIGGILIMPLNDQLLQITRSSESHWESKSVLPVSFATLIEPTNEKPAELCTLPDVEVMSLQDICRIYIRRLMRELIRAEHPGIDAQRPRPARKSGSRNRGRRKRYRQLHGMDDLSDDNGEEDHEEANEADDADEDTAEARRRREMVPRILRQMASMQNNLIAIARSNGRIYLQRRPRVNREEQEEEEEEEEEENEIDDTTSEDEDDEGVEVTDDDADDHLLPVPPEVDQDGGAEPAEIEVKVKNVDSSDGDMELDVLESSIATGVMTSQDGNGSSASTSVTSGVGTCSSVEEQSDFDQCAAADSHAAADTSGLPIVMSTNSTEPDKAEVNDVINTTDLSNDTHAPGDEKDIVVAKVTEPEVAQNMDIQEFLQSGPESDNETGSVMEASSTSGDDDVIDDETEDEDEEVVEDHVEDHVPTVSWRLEMKNHVERLPVPVALRNFLLFYR